MSNTRLHGGWVEKTYIPPCLTHLGMGLEIVISNIWLINAFSPKAPIHLDLITDDDEQTLTDDE